jgi:hypothetical protein
MQIDFVAAFDFGHIDNGPVRHMDQTIGQRLDGHTRGA